MSPLSPAKATLSERHVLALATACGFTVANLYYSQPLLPSMAAAFGRGTEAQGAIAMMTQVGYAAGLLLFGPMGDRFDRRRLTAILLLANAASLLFCATAVNLAWLLAGSMLLGLTAVSAQIIIPAVSSLVDPARRGLAVGRLMSGMFAGILLARTVSGYVGEYAGWRQMFMLAAGLDLAAIALVWRFLPLSKGSSDLSYPRLLASLGQLFAQQPALRQACLSGFLLFAAFNVFWGSLASMLARPPYGYESGTTGLFGLVGIVGMLASPAIGRLADRWGGRRVVALAAGLVLAAFMLFFGAASHLGWLIAGIVVLDLGSRGNAVANPAGLYALLPEARGRLNTVFMSCYFLGGATGAALGSAAGSSFGWSGIAVAGMLCAAVVLGAMARADAAEGSASTLALRARAVKVTK